MELVPSHFCDLKSNEELDNLEKAICDEFSLDSPRTVRTETEMWNQEWSSVNVMQRPATVLHALQKCQPLKYPQIQKVSVILYVLYHLYIRC